MENDQKNMLKYVKWRLSFVIFCAFLFNIRAADFDGSPSPANPTKFKSRVPASAFDFQVFISGFETFLRNTPKGQKFIEDELRRQFPQTLSEFLNDNVLARYQRWYDENQKNEAVAIGRKHIEAMQAANAALEASTNALEDLRRQHLAKEQAQEEAIRALTQAQIELSTRHEQEKRTLQAELEDANRQHVAEIQAAKVTLDAVIIKHSEEMQVVQEKKDQDHERALKTAEVASELALEKAQEALARALAELSRQHADEVRTKAQEHDDAMRDARTASDSVLDDLRRQHANALQATREEATGAVAARREEQDASTRVLEDLRRQLKEEARARGQVHDDAMRDARTASDRVLDDLRRQHANALQATREEATGAVAARREEQGKTEVMLAEADQRRELQTEEVISRSELKILASKTLASFVEQPQQRTLTLEETFAQAYKDGKYDPFFEILKAQARDKFTALMLRFSEGQFLHDTVVVGSEKGPQNPTREAFISFGLSVIESLTMQSALAGEHFKAVIVPRDNKEEERTRFTKALRGFIVNTLGYNINSLRTDSDDFFCDETVKYDCGVEDELKYFKAILSAGLR
jgi:hypothetical protein